MELLLVTELLVLELVRPVREVLVVLDAPVIGRAFDSLASTAHKMSNKSRSKAA